MADGRLLRCELRGGREGVSKIAVDAIRPPPLLLPVMPACLPACLPHACGFDVTTIYVRVCLLSVVCFVCLWSRGLLGVLLSDQDTVLCSVVFVAWLAFRFRLFSMFSLFLFLCAR